MTFFVFLSMAMKARARKKRCRIVSEEQQQQWSLLPPSQNGKGSERRRRNGAPFFPPPPFHHHFSILRREKKGRHKRRDQDRRERKEKNGKRFLSTVSLSLFFQSLRHELVCSVIWFLCPQKRSLVAIFSSFLSSFRFHGDQNAVTIGRKRGERKSLGK